MQRAGNKRKATETKEEYLTSLANEMNSDLISDIPDILEGIIDEVIVLGESGFGSKIPPEPIKVENDENAFQANDQPVGRGDGCQKEPLPIVMTDQKTVADGLTNSDEKLAAQAVGDNILKPMDGNKIILDIVGQLQDMK